MTVVTVGTETKLTVKVLIMTVVKIIVVTVTVVSETVILVTLTDSNLRFFCVFDALV